MTDTWGTLRAKERSHTWRVTRGLPATRTCSSCLDDLDSQARYCPGTEVTSLPIPVAETQLTLPDLENPSAVA